MGECRRCEKSRVPMRSVFGLCVPCTTEAKLLSHRKFYTKPWRVVGVLALPEADRVKLWGKLRKRLIGILGQATLAEWLDMDLHCIAADLQTPPTIAGAVRVLGYLMFVEARRDLGETYPIDAARAAGYVTRARLDYATILASEPAQENALTPPRTRGACTSAH